MFSTTLKKLFITAAIAVPLALSLGVVAPSGDALAASPSEQQCKAAGGDFTRDGGQVKCVYPTQSEPVGNSDKPNDHKQTVDTTPEETSNGTLNNKPKHEEAAPCKGPGNGGSTAQC